MPESNRERTSAEQPGRVAAAVARLRAMGQSVWMDDLSRQMIDSGQLARLRDLGVTGITDNPTTFDKAVTSSDLYDSAIRRLAGDHDAAAILWELMVEDVRCAADQLRPVYDQTAGADGFVSIEVSPDVAYDTDRTIAMARDLWARCDRPNVLVKIPATAAGLPAIRRMLMEGVNVNVTLTFSVRRYQEVVEAFLSGLEARRERGQPLDRIASVASFFVSRVDTKVDRLLDRARAVQKGVGEADVMESLRGTIGIANSKLAYARFRRLHAGERWERLAAAGARPQRCLWASTSVKDPAYPATMYVEALAGPDTVDTMPSKTLDALPDARLDSPALVADAQTARDRVRTLEQIGIGLDRVTAELEAEGVRSFTESYRHLVRAIEDKIAVSGRGAVDRTGEDSFPASEPPGRAGHTIGGRRGV